MAPSTDPVALVHEDREAERRRRQNTTTGGGKNVSETMIIMQHSEDPNERVVFMAGMPAHGVASATLSVLTLANYVHV